MFADVARVIRPSLLVGFRHESPPGLAMASTEPTAAPAAPDGPGAGPGLLVRSGPGDPLATGQTPFQALGHWLRPVIVGGPLATPKPLSTPDDRVVPLGPGPTPSRRDRAGGPPGPADSGRSFKLWPGPCTCAAARCHWAGWESCAP